MRLAERWKIGGKGSNDGVLVTLFLADHKMRIEVGYDLEDKLTDALSARVIREVMAPRLKAGDLEGALREGARTIYEITGGKGTGALRPQRSSPSPRFLFLLFILFLLLFGGRRRGGGLGWFLLGSALGGRGGGWSGGSGGWSGGGGGGGFSGGGGSFGGGGSSGSW